MESNQTYNVLSVALADKIMAEIRVQECLHPECANGSLRKALMERLSGGKDVEIPRPTVSTAIQTPTTPQVVAEPKATPAKTLKSTKYATKPLRSDDGYFFKERQLRDEASSGEFYEIKVFDDNTCEISLRTTGIDRNTLRDSAEVMPSEVVVSNGDITAECQIVVDKPAQGELKDRRIYIVEQMNVSFKA